MTPLAPWLAAPRDLLAERLRRGAMPHALLIAGAEGLGKRALAAQLAAMLLCARGADGPCGRCRACLLLAAGSHPDRVEVTLGLRDDGKPRTEIVVDQVRALSERLAMTPQFGGYQVVIVDPADAMNASAANALLKTLEEPTPGTVIALVSDHPSRLPATIRSRCQRVLLVPPARAQALDWLAKHNVPEAATVLDAAAGNPGLALALAGSGGIAARAEVIRDLCALWNGSAAPVEVANRWAKAELAPRLWFAAQLGAEEATTTARGARGPLALTPAAEFHKLAAWIRDTGRTREQLRGPVRPELAALDILLAWCDMAPARARRA